MKKYLQIMNGTWAEYMMYRLNFVLWRVRVVIQLLITYFLWWAIFSARNEFFGYTQAQILTYVLLSSFVRTLVLGTTTMEIGAVINSGTLSNYLVRPISFFKFYIAKDIGDKGLNLAFSIVEIILLVGILQPPLFWQTNPAVLFLGIVSLLLGTALYFCFSLILGFLGFWTPDIWAPRFLSFVVMDFFAGGLFPLDILPRPLYLVSQSLPFSYFIYFPIKVYLGQLSTVALAQGLITALAWLIGLYCIAQLIWRQGLRVYTAEGR